MPEINDDAAHRRLYASVIIQALIDATAEPRNSGVRVYRDQARAWIETSVGVTAQNFEAVCLAAEVAPDRVRTFLATYEGPPLTLHKLSRLRNSFLERQANGNQANSKATTL